MRYCARCGAKLAPDGRCRFAVPRGEAPWLTDEAAATRDPDSLLPVARWLLHHPEAADRRRLEWARRTAGVQEDPD